jgi:hypothetical protein
MGCVSRDDALAMPYITIGNIYVPVMMLAEKSADLILGNTSLPPSSVRFCRHEGQRPTRPARDRGRVPRSADHRSAACVVSLLPTDVRIEPVDFDESHALVKTVCRRAVTLATRLVVVHIEDHLVSSMFRQVVKRRVKKLPAEADPSTFRLHLDPPNHTNSGNRRTYRDLAAARFTTDVCGDPPSRKVARRRLYMHDRFACIRNPFAAASGLTAAARAALAGARVVLGERAPTLGGSGIYAGFIWTTPTHEVMAEVNPAGDPDRGGLDRAFRRVADLAEFSSTWRIDGRRGRHPVRA